MSDGDISRVSPSPATTLAEYEISSLLDQLKVKNIMSKRVIAINADATIEEAAYLMERNNISGLPVVSDVSVVVGGHHRAGHPARLREHDGARRRQDPHFPLCA